MKTLNVIMAALIVSGGMFLGCDNYKVEAAAANRSVAIGQNIMPKLLGHQVVELPVIDTLAYEEIPGVVSLEKMGCSAFAKILSNGDMVVGRSMDIFYKIHMNAMLSKLRVTSVLVRYIAMREILEL